MERLPTRKVLVTVALSLLLVLAGCSGGADDPAAGTASPETPAGSATPADQSNQSSDGGDGEGVSDPRVESNRYAGPGNATYLFDEGEAYAWAADDGNRTLGMTWAVVAAGNESRSITQGLRVNTTVDRVGRTTTEAYQVNVFEEVIREDTVGGLFLYLRTPAVLAAGQRLEVGHSWQINGDDVHVGNDIGVDWDEATAEITGTATVSGESCYEMQLRLPGNQTGPTSCVKEDWPFALAVDTAGQDYELVSYQRP